VSTYKSANVDFDALFDPDTVGDGPTAPTYKQGGVPLKYADIKYGTKGPNCGYAENSVDLSNKWAKKGSASYGLAFDGLTYLDQNNLQANLTFTFTSATTWSISGPGTVTGGPLTGTLTTFGAPTQFYLSEVTFNPTAATVDTATQNSWQPITAGLMLFRYRTTGLTGNAVAASCKLQLRDASGKVLSTNTINFQIQSTNPQ